jgi:hypothetical protein
MSRKIYNRLSFMAVSSLDESTLMVPGVTLTESRCGCYKILFLDGSVRPAAGPQGVGGAARLPT